jgi:hypothetical protein
MIEGSIWQHTWENLHHVVQYEMGETGAVVGTNDRFATALATTNPVAQNHIVVTISSYNGAMQIDVTCLEIDP